VAGRDRSVNGEMCEASKSEFGLKCRAESVKVMGHCCGAARLRSRVDCRRAARCSRQRSSRAGRAASVPRARGGRPRRTAPTSPCCAQRPPPTGIAASTRAVTAAGASTALGEVGERS
jgi:hypothetical protein